jgi:hypothetical protein
MSDAEFVECWFIGGPWGNQLATLHRRFLEPGAVLRVPVPLTKISIAADCALSPLDVEHKTADYYRQESLETGVPVFSCLEGRYGGHYTRFYLTSITQTST